MLFSSNIFIFLFLPLFLVLYYFIHVHFRNKILDNFILLCLSLFFYLWGNGSFVFLLYLSIVGNYLFGRLIQKSSRAKLILSLGIVFNFSFLFYFKYANFASTQIVQPLASTFNLEPPTIIANYLPVGISFFTFMAISYLVDIYRKEVKAASLLDFGLYLSLFPHLVAGPIIRFNQLKDEIASRKVNFDIYFEGMTRFIFGLGKKVILANNLGLIADKIFASSSSELTIPVAWLGVLLYTLQIYFDFSGYTDMAIGLAKFFGFHFPENFNRPYLATSMTDFWRRWHMTLCNWFRDYVYIPLGGNRLGSSRTYFNILIVFLLTGVWHGANWTFIVWGIYNGLILIIERFLVVNYKFELKGLLGNLVTFALVMIGWVFFRSTTLENALGYLTAMFGMNQISYEIFKLSYYLTPQNMIYLSLGLIFVFFPFEKIAELLKNWGTVPAVSLRGVFCLVILAYAILLLSKAQFTPFIYFQF